MVRPIIAVLTASVSLLAQASAELDLTPVDSYYIVEGTRSPNLNFHDDAKVISYTPPSRWRPNGAGKKMTLIPPDKPQAMASIQALPATPADLPATADNAKAYAEIATKALPREATKVEVVTAGVAPMRVSGYFMVQVTLTYIFFGQEVTSTTYFMPRPKEQIRFQITCRSVDYKELFRPFEVSLYSIQGLEVPDTDPAAAPAKGPKKPLGTAPAPATTTGN